MDEPSTASLSISDDVPVVEELLAIHSPASSKPLTIKTSSSAAETGEKFSNPISPAISFSPYLNSPSPPSSAFVSALQSPYISPRALDPALLPEPKSTTPLSTTTVPSPTSYSGGSQSDDIPSCSYTPPSERYDFCIDLCEQKPKVSSDAGSGAQPRVSFSFPAPRVSFARGPVSPSPNTKLRSCDVYIGFHGQSPHLARFCKWLKSELELHGIASFAADRAKYPDNQSHEIADRIICSAAFGVVVVTPASFLNTYSLEEMKFFSQKKNLMPILFEMEMSEIELEDKDCKEAFQGLSRCGEFKLEANESNWRSCILKSVGILRSKLGRKCIAEKENEEFHELPFSRNSHFVGREKEISEIEAAFFGCADVYDVECTRQVVPSGGSSGLSDGFADEESDAARNREPTLEAWIDPVIDLTGKGRGALQMQRSSKHKRTRIGSSRCYGNAGVVCMNGASGIGKTELALEFAYRFSQRYRMVLWVGGEARYFRQNILNLALILGLDISAESEKERGRIRSFEEQELDAFQRVKRELFRDVPYLLVIDDLETERDWWEGKDLHDFIPRNTGATHVIITTRLAKVMSFDPLQLPPLSFADALYLMRGKRKNEYAPEEIEVLRKFDERLGRLCFGLWVVGSLLSELLISPSELLEAIERISLHDSGFSCCTGDDGLVRNNSFLMKVLMFCFVLMERAKGGALAAGMVLAGAWFAPAPVSAALLAAAANKMPSRANGFQLLGESILMAFVCGSQCRLAPHARRNEVESALLLVKLGLAKRTAGRSGYWIQFHKITQLFGRMKGGTQFAAAAIHGVVKTGSSALHSDHLWASAFLLFGFKSEPPTVQLKVEDMVLFIKKTALPLAIRSFMTFSRCSSALEVLKVCTNILEEVEKSFASRIEDPIQRALCWKKRIQTNRRVDEYIWQEATLLKAALLETRAKLLMRGGHFDAGEELCRTCISIRTVMLGHGHAQTLAAQETLAKLVRYRSKI